MRLVIKLLILTSSILFLTHFPTLGKGTGGVQGTIEDVDGTTLPFATIYVRNIKTGSSSNAEGYYKINLPPGKYDLVFQFMGYETKVETVEIGQTFIELNVQLKPQTIVLRTVEIKAQDEDPSYTVMRKAIAKAKYYTQLIDTMSAKVYIKGSGRLISAPFFLRKRLKKEGIDSATAFINESVSIIKYKRPNTFEEQVISIRTFGDNQNVSPNQFVNGSFYEPEIAGVISPLSPRAFAYYKFVHEGTFFDKGYMVNKIKVIPRSKGDNVFWGYIYILEGSWAIHSLDLRCTKLGINFHLTQICDEVHKGVWLPITHKVEVNGKVLGFNFEGHYLATVSDFYIELNPDLDVDFQVVDEKVDKELAKELKPKLDIKTAQLEEKLANGNEITRKELRKVMKEYEKMELDTFNMPDILSSHKMTIDSTAYKSDPKYWTDIRPIPLSSYEVRGYHKMDSITVAQEEKAKKDTLKAERKRNFHIEDLILGNSYRLGDHSRIIINSVLENLGFNTVEGYNLVYGLRYSRYFDGRNRLQFGPDIRYSFARNKISGRGILEYRFGKRITQGRLFAEGGVFVDQFNHDQPIHPLVNTFTSLFLSKNYMKIYEKDYGRIGIEKRLTPKFRFNIQFDWEQRHELVNNTSHTWIKYEDYGYKPNEPLNLELASTSFPVHQSSVLQLGVELEPFKKFRIDNGRKRPVRGSSPIFNLTYVKGINKFLESDVDFDLIKVMFRYQFTFGVRGNVDLRLTAGKFLNKSGLYFMDYAHYLGNRTPFVTTDPVGSFRLLDYYLYSTNNQYFTGHLHYQFRKFLFTQIFLLRAAGIRENILINHLEAPTANHYSELGYSIDYILRIFRIEFVTSFQNFKYQDFGVRIGIATNLDNLFGGPN